MKYYQRAFALLLLIVFLQSCKTVDLRSEALKSQSIENAETKGRDLLSEAKLAMGYDKLEHTQVYQVNAKFNWKGIWLLMPMNTFPGNNNKELLLKLATNSFDGQLTYLEGRKKGTIQGVQSWTGYKAETNSDYLKRHECGRYIWGLATYHYLMEAPMHLPKAEIVKYAGQKEIDNINYDTVYVTWGSEAPNKTYDRLLVYVNPETKFIDLLEVTINDFFLPMPKGLQHATARYERTKTTIGTYLPSHITIQLKSPKDPKNKVYSVGFDNYEFDSFEKEKLYPIQGLSYYGLSKPSKK
ncbi:hypothetical protein [uncultured Psychroserpens sp.]|uniref:hypothetical protein n=1 Tax=uncultured Psychroserpens sp. TaxID=255436 RepID=UPI00262AEB5E|nr:hypothetical protein [uncultured Psychroserpens sp.]